MAIKLSIFTTVTRPFSRGDNYVDAFNCYNDLADEVVVINGDPVNHKLKNSGKFKIIDSVWPSSFSWDFIGKQFQKGYESCTGDWSIHADIDFIFHENDFARIRRALEDYPNSPAVSFYKWQFILPDRYNLKSRLIVAVNKKVYGDRIKFNGGGDLCQPTLDGKELDLNSIPQAGVPFYNYEKILKTETQIKDDVTRMALAWTEYFNNEHLGNEKTAYVEWLKMAVGRFSKPHLQIPLKEHPKYVQNTIKNLKPEQWGYSGFSNLVVNNYVTKDL